MAWAEDESIFLISLWADENIQSQLEGCRYNRNVYEKLSKQMGDDGYERSPTQCREKIKKLRNDYKRIKDRNTKTGRERRARKLFEKLDEILGHRPSTMPVHLLDSSSANSKDNEIEETLEKEPLLEEEVEEVGQDEGNIIDNKKLADDGASDVSSNSRSSATANSKISRKRSVPEGMLPAPSTKRASLETTVDAMVSTVTKLQEASDARFLNLSRKGWSWRVQC